MPDFNILDNGFTINSPVQVGIRDIDGDIATLLTDTLFAKGSDLRTVAEYGGPVTYLPQDRENTYWKRWMYFYLSATSSQKLLKGWGDQIGTVSTVKGGGSVDFSFEGAQIHINVHREF